MTEAAHISSLLSCLCLIASKPRSPATNKQRKWQQNQLRLGSAFVLLDHRPEPSTLALSRSHIIQRQVNFHHRMTSGESFEGSGWRQHRFGPLPDTPACFSTHEPAKFPNLSSRCFHHARSPLTIASFDRENKSIKKVRSYKYRLALCTGTVTSSGRRLRSVLGNCSQQDARPCGFRTRHMA